MMSEYQMVSCVINVNFEYLYFIGASSLLESIIDYVRMV